MPRPRSSRFIHTFYLLVIAILGTLLFVERQERTADSEHLSVSEQLSQLQHDFEQRLNDFEKNIADQLEQAEQRMEESSTESMGQGLVTAPPASTQNPPISQRVEQQDSENGDRTPDDSANANTRADLHASISAGLLDDFAQKESQFSIQSVDPDWAYPTRDLIREQFNEDDYLKTLHLRDIECRSSLCQVDLDVLDTSTINPARLMMALNQINQNEYDYRYVLRSSAQENSYRVLVERADQTSE